MITVSVCLIVLNEEKILARCLRSFSCIADEIIVVDTGSTDNTKKIAADFTDKIYDFKWVNDFSKARNYAFSKCNCDYIYSCDADEVLDEENIKKFENLKNNLPENVEIVQMFYKNQLEFNTTYNYDKELRTKLFKRKRDFVWEECVHEQIRLTPVIFDSDIEITHMPLSLHSKRDFKVIKDAILRGEAISKRLWEMYAKELFISGDNEDFLEAGAIFESYVENNILDESLLRSCLCVIAKASLIKNDIIGFFAAALKNVGTNNPSGEICYMLSKLYYDTGKYEDAYLWAYNGIFEAQSECCIKYQKEMLPKLMLNILEKTGRYDEKEVYEKLICLT
ncbi:MAG: glycosyltransferase family 2 protein [Lachnospiraceae bacterium]|nr:glycosyltransferase family 2 protein [Lachnospiraceae bacterium]